jgi:sigma-B regulation protein RsbU (phosphoserine phosphatase)
VFALGEMVAVIVGDASGHGRAALRRATLTHYTLRAYLEAGLPPRAVLELAGRVRTGEDDGEFATAVVALYDPAQVTLTYAWAGHPRPLVQGPGLDDCAVTACSPPPLGGFGVPTGQRQTTVRIPAGGVACLFTDGVVEARIGADLFGRDRLAELVGRLGPEATARELVDTVRAQPISPRTTWPLV